MATARADVGIFGGSGFFTFLEGAQEVAVETPYGEPAGKLRTATVGDHRIAFLPRHGPRHDFAPHRVPYRANVWAMKALGVRWLIGPCAAGSLQPHVKPGDFVVCDQLVDRTWGRPDTYHEDEPVDEQTHISYADPYCEELRQLLVATARDEGLPVHERGTVVVVQGPRFSTRAESAWYRSAGWEVVNMTQYPEAYLARELGLCYANVSLVTDYDAGLEGVEGVEPVTYDEVIRVFEENLDRLRSLLLAAVARLPVAVG